MKRHLIAFGIVILLLAVGLSGCNEQSEEEKLYRICRQKIQTEMGWKFVGVDEFWIKDYDESSVYLVEDKNYYRVEIAYGMTNYYMGEPITSNDFWRAKAKKNGEWEIKVYDIDMYDSLSAFWRSW